jgi:hypothetical protein
MNRHDWGPPDKEGRPPITTPGASHHHHRQSLTKNQQHKPNAASRHGTAWREGFGYGFRDALRCAARRTDDPDVWAMLSRLADEYDLAGGDD